MSLYNAEANLQPLVGEISWTKHIIILKKCKNSQTLLPSADAISEKLLYFLEQNKHD